MSNANVALVQSLYAAFKRADIAPILAALTPDAHWEAHGRSKDHPALGPFKGPQGAGKFFGIVAETQDVVDFSPREYYAVDGKVFVLGHYKWTMRKSGKPVACDWVHVFTIQGGKVASFHEFTDTGQFAEALRG